MDINVVAILLFMLFAIFTPISLILTSKALRRLTTRNKVRDQAYESGEESTGTRIAIMHEYLHYFTMFISFEILAAVVLVWAPVSKSVGFTPSIAVLGLLVVGVVFEVFMLVLARMVE